jgi:phosphatidylglycerol lysyltransferase
LNPGLELWFSREGDAVVGYVVRGRMAVVAGAPVCSEERLPEVVGEWESWLADRKLGVCYFGAESRLRRLLEGRKGYSTVSLGAQPEWTVAHFLSAIRGDKSLRAQLNRARNKGVTIEEWDAEQATHNPDLRSVLEEWLETRGLPTLHFLVEPETLGDFRDRRLFVARLKGSVVGFVTLCPVPSRHGWLTEQFVRGRSAPNGTIELALDRAAEALVGDGDGYFTMGIVPLSPHSRMLAETHPLWLRALASWLLAHGRRFYNFTGLDFFKTKFHPDVWEPIVAISKEGRFSMRTLRAIAAAFTVQAPEIAVLAGLWKAVRQEAKWLLSR